ncbi:MAG TPA: glycosyltransferase [Pseudonocardiaceae bacterium]|jgi:glycosyltransferase involved in cell wall biosynthesis|nr:glycosyltransferase [Pseudonocardiaceae bacterium]
MILAVGVVIPAQNEAELIGNSLRHLRVALAKLPWRIERAVCVVADRCVDDTARIARAEFAGWPNARIVPNHRAATIGELRHLGVVRLTTMLTGHQPAETLLLSTDADSTVDAGWGLAHLRLAERGWHAVAGVAELAQSLSPAAAARYRIVRRQARAWDGQGNVYGANLGFRADAYAAIGGFGPLTSGEDQDLWRRLGASGFRLTCATEPVVHTSARRNGRADGGVATLLHRLHQDDRETSVPFSAYGPAQTG